MLTNRDIVRLQHRRHASGIWVYLACRIVWDLVPDVQCWQGPSHEQLKACMPCLMHFAPDLQNCIFTWLIGKHRTTVSAHSKINVQTTGNQQHQQILLPQRGAPALWNILDGTSQPEGAQQSVQSRAKDCSLICRTSGTCKSVEHVLLRAASCS